MTSNALWLAAQMVRTQSAYTARLRSDFEASTHRVHESLAALMAQLPDAALSVHVNLEGGPVRSFDLSPFLPGQPSALRPAYVRSVDYTGFALLTVYGGLALTEPADRRIPLLLHLDRIDGDALYEALKPWLPTAEPVAPGDPSA